jgi:hypothetical protein
MCNGMTRWPVCKSYSRLVLSQKLIDEAAARSKLLPVFSGSHRGAAGNLVGCIGEIAFKRFLTRNGVFFENNTEKTTHDYIVGPRRITVDVKTKDRTVKPRQNFSNSVPLYNHSHQRPDVFYFISLLREGDIYKEAFLLGAITCKKLDNVGKVWKAGEVDLSNGTKFWTACINVSMQDLFDNGQTIKAFKAP